MLSLQLFTLQYVCQNLVCASTFFTHSILQQGVWHRCELKAVHSQSNSGDLTGKSLLLAAICQLLYLNYYYNSSEEEVVF